MLKPSPYQMGHLTEQARVNFNAVVQLQEPVNSPVDLYEAMARAIKYNLDYRVSVSEANLRNAQLNLANYAMLPNIVANSGYSSRSNVQATSSLNVLTNTINYGASTSQDRVLKTNDISFSWNILDFGLSYVRARQAGDKYLISLEMKRKVIHKLLDDVRKAYWRALTSGRLLRRLKKIAGRMQRAQVNSHAVSQASETPKLEALLSERGLIEVKQAMVHLQGDVHTAKAELAALINIRPGEPFTLATLPHPDLPAEFHQSLDEMMLTALRNRSELRENLYEQRINMGEAKAALLELLPGLQVFGGPNWDSNSFTLNNHWVSWAVTASWNLVRVFQYPAKRRLLEAHHDTLKMRARAISMSVLTQVYLSRIRYQLLYREYVIADEYLRVQKRLIEQYRIEAQAGRISEQQLLREELNTLIAGVKYDLAHADLQSAYADIYASIGWDPYVSDLSGSSVEEIAANLKRNWTHMPQSSAAGSLETIWTSGISQTSIEVVRNE